MKPVGLNQLVLTYISKHHKKFEYGMPNNYYFQMQTFREDNSKKNLLVFGSLVDVVAHGYGPDFVRAQNDPIIDLLGHDLRSIEGIYDVEVVDGKATIPIKKISKNPVVNYLKSKVKFKAAAQTLNIEKFDQIADSLFYNLSNDMKYLLSLDKELWYEGKIVTENRLTRTESTIGNNKSRRISTKEEETLLEMIVKNEFTLRPKPGNFGFAPVLIISDSKNKRELCRIDSFQLNGKGENSKLVAYCFGKKNKNLQKSRGIEFEDLSYYEY